MGNQQLYTKCKLSGVGMEKKKVMRSWIKAARKVIQMLTAKAYSQILHTSEKRKRPAWSFTNKRRKDELIIEATIALKSSAASLNNVRKTRKKREY